MSKKITLLGSTGSIGTQSLDVIRAQGYEVFGLSAHSHVDKILQQIHAQVHETTVEHEDQSIRVTMSMGLVQADRNASEDAMLAAADALLYYCKEHGRDQIQVKDMSGE